MMRTLAMPILAFLSIASSFAGGADSKFQAGPVNQYSHQENDKVTVGAKAFTDSEEVKRVFGKKVDLDRFGVLPVLLVIQNGRKQSLDLNALQVRLVPGRGKSIVPIDTDQVTSLGKTGGPPTINPQHLPRFRKNPLDSLTIVERAFAAQMVPSNENASGFFYFEARPESGMKLLVEGIYERPSGKEILYFEIPL
jgi:hypothetical protein